MNQKNITPTFLFGADTFITRFPGPARVGYMMMNKLGNICVCGTTDADNIFLFLFYDGTWIEMPVENDHVMLCENEPSLILGTSSWTTTMLKKIALPSTIVWEQSIPDYYDFKEVDTYIIISLDRREFMVMDGTSGNVIVRITDESNLPFSFYLDGIIYKYDRENAFHHIHIREDGNIVRFEPHHFAQDPELDFVPKWEVSSKMGSLIHAILFD